MKGLTGAVIGQWLGYRKGIFSPTTGQNAGNQYPWLQISLGEEEVSMDFEPYFFTTDQSMINESNIEKENKAYKGKRVKLTGYFEMKNGKPALRVQYIEEAKE